MATHPAIRVEHDLLGSLDVPADAYYGIHTLRAVRNFKVTGRILGDFGQLVASLALVKQAAALANRELGLLGPDQTAALVAACLEVRAGALASQFVVDLVQGGAGTSMNLNANEVLANRALEILGLDKGSYDVVHPLQDVNRSQSTNDVYPTALRLATHSLVGDLVAALALLEEALVDRAEAFAGLVKLGRTQLQDAVPMTLGQEFRAFATAVANEQANLLRVAELLLVVNLGGTAIGTGITAPPAYRDLVLAHLNALAGGGVTLSPDLIDAASDTSAFVSVSAAVRRAAVRVSKISSDLRLLSSGPRAGFGEINMPAVQSGSSIMPGKVNPVIPELVNQVAFEVMGLDVTVGCAAESGQLQLNAFEPVIGWALWLSTTHLTAACRALATQCVLGISANPSVLRRNAAETTGLLTTLSATLGYEQATSIALEARRSDRPIGEVVAALGLMTAAEFGLLSDQHVDPASFEPVPAAVAASPPGDEGSARG